MLPREDEYNQAVQNPQIAFGDADFLTCQVETTRLGLPKPYSGGFTTTYKFFNSTSSWAARCFTRDVPDLQRRYQVIGQFIARTNSPYFVEAKYLTAGIKVNARLYPVIKMKWVEGELLNAFLRKNHHQPLTINHFINNFERLIRQLEQWNIAHGDLQCGNILVQNGNLVLIDYDGMFLPELAQLKANEIGHPDFQHPARTAGQFNGSLDRFAAIVIYLGAKALSLQPSLWSRYDNGENVLFTRSDFRNPQQSSLLNELSSISALKQLAQQFTGVCHLPFQEIPTLQEFIDGHFKYTIPAPGVSFGQPKRSPVTSFSVHEEKVFAALYNHKKGVGQPPLSPVMPAVDAEDYSGGIAGVVAALLIMMILAQLFFNVIPLPAVNTTSSETIDTIDYYSPPVVDVPVESVIAPNSKTETLPDRLGYAEELFRSWYLDYSYNQSKFSTLSGAQFRSLFPASIAGIRRTDFQWWQPFAERSIAEALDIRSGRATYRNNKETVVYCDIERFNLAVVWHDLYDYWFRKKDNSGPTEEINYWGVPMLLTYLYGPDFLKPIGYRIGYYAGGGFVVSITAYHVMLRELKYAAYKLSQRHHDYVEKYKKE